MSKFFRALEQAKRDRALASGVSQDYAPPVEEEAFEEPQGVEVAVETEPVPPVGIGRRTEFTAPASDLEVADAVDDHLVSLVTPASFEAEQYRALRHIVEQLHRTANLQVIAVSSPGAGDGKTVTAINLAGALAQAREARVLLIDADLRRPNVNDLLALPALPGADLVSAILNPTLTLRRIAQPRPPFNLSVVCAGPAQPSPYELLKSPRLDDLMEEARQEYDYVIIDTPPLTPIQDCRLIGRFVDGFLVVVAAHRTQRRLLEEGLTTLDRTKVVGIVFNAEDGSRSIGYSGYSGIAYAPPDQPGPGNGSRGILERTFGKLGERIRRQRGSASSSSISSERPW